jgi:nucleoside-diphosphate-sugar epimerase
MVHKPSLESIRGAVADELVCAGLPGAKYLANADPEGDWTNTRKLAEVLSTVRAERVVLMSTVDVYENPSGVDESSPASFDAAQAYGRNRAWFEAFVRATFPGSLVVRLPALYGDGLRKNLVFDLLEGRSDQVQRVAGSSTFQFFDIDQTWGYVEKAVSAGISVVNFVTEPVRAADVAKIFGVDLPASDQAVGYDVRTMHAESLGGDTPGYLGSRSDQLEGIRRLKMRWNRSPSRAPRS